MRFDSAIWIIYLQSRGLSLTGIGLAEAAFHMAPLLFELPSGSFADLVGRRWALATGSLLVAVSSALLWSAHSLPVAMLALFVMGASFSFRSGADHAYLFDILGSEEDGRRSFPSLLGRMLGAMYLVGAAAAWIGAAVSDFNYGYTFSLAIGVGLGGAWLAPAWPSRNVCGAPKKRWRRRARCGSTWSRRATSFVAADCSS